MSIEKEKDPLVVQVGQRIQKYRNLQNMTQDQVAELAGISQKHLSRIEQGYHNPRFDMIIQIAQALHIPTDALAKDMSDDDIDVYIAAIKPEIEKLNSRQREFLKKSIDLLNEIEF